MTRARLLGVVAVGYVVLDVLHFADHLRQGRTLATQIYLAGNVGLVVAIVVAVLAMRAHPFAPAAAAAFGVAAAVGVAATHLLPAWGFFSDSYTALHLDALSWVSAWSLVVCGLALAACGTTMLVRPGRSRLPAT